MPRKFEYPKTREEVEANGWTEVSEERYYYLLECLPPERIGPSAFAVGEPLCQLDEDYRDDTKTVYDCLVAVGRRYFSKPNTLDRFDPARFEAEVRAQYHL
jgi:hypothetical protein